MADPKSTLKFIKKGSKIVEIIADLFITKDHIAGSKPGDAKHCAIARCVRDVASKYKPTAEMPVEVPGDKIVMDGFRTDTVEMIQKFTREFDGCAVESLAQDRLKKVKPVHLKVRFKPSAF